MRTLRCRHPVCSVLEGSASAQTGGSRGMATVGKLEKGPEEPGCQQRHDQLWDKECSGVAWAGLAADR